MAPLDVSDEDVLRLRVGQKIIASAAVEDRALMNLSYMGRSYARRHGMRYRRDAKLMARDTGLVKA